MINIKRKGACVMNNRVEDFLTATRLNELLNKKEAEEKNKNVVLWILAIIGAVAAVAGIAYAVYRFFTPDYLDDFEDDFDDDFDDDFFEDEEDEE
jgi:flagellar basal body-associated protein FliL